MDLSIVISNYDQKGELLRCVDHLLCQDASAGTYEVLLPLHGKISEADRSTLTRLAAREPRLRLLDLPQDNRSLALNRGVRAAQADIVMLVESHVLCPPDHGGHFRQQMEQAPIAAILGAYEAAAGGTWTSDMESAARRASSSRRQNRGLSRDEFSIHVAAIRKTDIERFGGFPEAWPGIAEQLLLQRLHDGGGRIAWSEQPVALHINHQDWDDFLDALARRNREFGRLWARDPSFAARVLPHPTLEQKRNTLRRLRWLIRPLLRMDAGVSRLLLALARRMRIRPLKNAAARRRIARLSRHAFAEGFLTCAYPVSNPT